AGGFSFRLLGNFVFSMLPAFRHGLIVEYCPTLLSETQYSPQLPEILGQARLDERRTMAARFRRELGCPRAIIGFFSRQQADASGHSYFEQVYTAPKDHDADHK